MLNTILCLLIVTLYFQIKFHPEEKSKNKYLVNLCMLVFLICASLGFIWRSLVNRYSVSINIIHSIT